MKTRRAILVNNTQLENSLPALTDYEGAITSALNVRPDEVILKQFSDMPFRGLNASVCIRFVDGLSIDLPLHGRRGMRSVFGIGNGDITYWTLFIPEKLYIKSNQHPELKTLLKDLFGNQRSIDVTIDEKIDQITIESKELFKKSRFKMTFIR